MNPPPWVSVSESRLSIRAGTPVGKRVVDLRRGETTQEVGFHEELFLDLALELRQRAFVGNRLVADDPVGDEDEALDPVVELVPTYQRTAVPLAHRGTEPLGLKDIGTDRQVCLPFELWPITLHVPSASPGDSAAANPFRVESTLPDGRALAFGYVSSGTTVYAVHDRRAVAARERLRIAYDDGLATSTVPGPGEYRLVPDRPVIDGAEAPKSAEIALLLWRSTRPIESLWDSHVEAREIVAIQYEIDGMLLGWASFESEQDETYQWQRWDEYRGAARVSPGDHTIRTTFWDRYGLWSCDRPFTVPDSPESPEPDDREMLDVTCD